MPLCLLSTAAEIYQDPNPKSSLPSGGKKTHSATKHWRIRLFKVKMFFIGTIHLLSRAESNQIKQKILNNDFFYKYWRRYKSPFKLIHNCSESRTWNYTKILIWSSLDRRVKPKLLAELDEKIDEKIDEKFDEKIDEKFDEKIGWTMVSWDTKLTKERKTGLIPSVYVHVHVHECTSVCTSTCTSTCDSSEQIHCMDSW